ncbi:hypothetical protein HZF02_15650 [Pseudomonas yamanorum]|nr:hypothetical protein HZF02_15650 [Pseudomonas yamanorum]
MSEPLKSATLAAGGIEWAWWTSNSVLRLTSNLNRGLQDGDVLSAIISTDGRPVLAIAKTYQDFIEAATPAAILRLTTERDQLQAIHFDTLAVLDAAKDEIERLKAGYKWEYERATLLLDALNDCEQRPAATDETNDKLSISYVRMGEREHALRERVARLEGLLRNARRYVNKAWPDGVHSYRINSISGDLLGDIDAALKQDTTPAPNKPCTYPNGIICSGDGTGEACNKCPMQGWRP